VGVAVDFDFDDEFLDDWELDDDEDAEGDGEPEDVWGGLGPGLDEGEGEGEWDLFEPAGGSGGGTAVTAGGDDSGGVNAWDVGTGFALAGWLLDRHADRIADRVGHQVAARDPNGPVPESRGPRPSSPSSAPSTLAGVDWDASPLRDGEPVTRSRLAVTIALRVGARRDLYLWARHPAAVDTDGEADFELSVLVQRLAPEHEAPSIVVRFEDPEGTAPARLADSFSRLGRGPSVMRLCTDTADAVNAVQWVLERYSLDWSHFTTRSVT
jgi:hypothetical protein